MATLTEKFDEVVFQEKLKETKLIAVKIATHGSNLICMFPHHEAHIAGMEDLIQSVQIMTHDFILNLLRLQMKETYAEGRKFRMIKDENGSIYQSEIEAAVRKLLTEK